MGKVSQRRTSGERKRERKRMALFTKEGKGGLK
jgi:hypothetical protein